jgi:hypothetical protein
VALINVLIDTDKTALKQGEKAFKSIGMNIAANPLEFAMVNGLMFRDRRQLVVLRLIPVTSD